MKMLALALLVGAQAFVTNPARSLRNVGMRTATRNVAAPQMLFGLTRVAAPASTAKGAPVTAREVRAAQALWASSIKKISAAYLEKGGFAINGGKGWSEVVFDNHQIDLNGETAIAMGNYYFTCATTGGKTKVEYTFGYKRCDDGKVRIFP